VIGASCVLAILGLAILLAVRAAATLARGDRGDRALVGIVVGVTFLELTVHGPALVELGFGAPRLTPPVLLLVAAGLAGIGATLLGRGRHPATPLATAPSTGADPRPAAPDVPGERPRTLGIAIGALVLFYLILGLEAVTSPPAGWDARVYHLPVALGWVQAGSLAIPAPDWRFALPGNGEVLAFLAYPLGVESLVTWGSGVGLVLLLLATRRLAATLGADRTSTTVVLLVVASVPLVAFQSASGYVDLFGAGFGVAAVALAVAPGVGSARPLVVGLALGLAVGTKPTMWLYALLAAVGVVGASVRRDGWSWPRALAFGAGIAIPAAFWFVRATLYAGNPFYPFAILGGAGVTPREITPVDYHLQYVPSTLHWFVYPWLETKRSGFPYGTGTGLGAPFATLVPLGMALAAIDAWRARHATDPVARRRLLAFAVLVGLILVWWVVLRRMPRFGIPVIVTAVLVAVPAVADRLRRVKSLGPVVLAATLVALALAGFRPAHDLASRLRHGRWDRGFSYGYPAVIDELPAGTTVWNASARDADNYSLVGADLDKRLVPDEWDHGLTAAEVIARHRVEVLVDRFPFELDAELEALGATLLVEESVGHRDRDGWRVWRVSPGGTTASSAPGAARR